MSVSVRLEARRGISENLTVVAPLRNGTSKVALAVERSVGSTALRTETVLMQATTSCEATNSMS